MREDWIESTLDQVCEKVLKVKRKEMPLSEKLKYLDIGAIDNHVNKIISHKEYTWEDAPSRAQQIIKKDDVLFSTVRTYLKNIAKVNKEEYNDEIVSSGFTVLRSKKGVLDSDYLFFRSLSTVFLNSLNKLQRGTSYPAVRDKDVFAQIIPLPPLVEQKAIVKRIEELFSSLDSGITDLKKAQDQLVIYRQAVLKKAFEGELTKEWREKQINLPTANELLEQIKEERQKHYDEQLTDWKEAVKVWEKNGKVERKPTKPRALKFVDEFTELELSELDKLPTEWKLVKLGNVFQVFVGSTPSRSKIEYWQNGNINWVSSGEVAFKSIYQTKEKITAKGLNNASTSLHPKGTVMLAMIGEGKTRGQAAILEIEACHNQNTAAIRVSEIGFEPKYLFHYLFLKYEGNRRVGSGNNQKALNQGRIMNFDFPLCSIQEQHQIVKEIESRLSVCDKVEKDIADSLEKAQALRQSILKKAFEGKLLSKEEIAKCKADAAYEPASVLLERIKKEKV
ncbi:restriction endonuclease subunit S [Algibacter sp. Ld11]|uniref:restriction endonuclease subunit S n=1 Tax=Algibacter sp. Ld11 TaxID=649150 RepID=UPI00386567F5